MAYDLLDFNINVSGNIMLILNPDFEVKHIAVGRTLLHTNHFGLKVVFLTITSNFWLLLFNNRKNHDREKKKARDITKYECLDGYLYGSYDSAFDILCVAVKSFNNR